MLIQIDQRTWLDLPRWKCRKEFVDLYLAKRDHHNDVDLIAKLQAKCDVIIEAHELKAKKRRKSQQTLALTK